MSTNVLELLGDCGTADVCQTVQVAAAQSDGIVVQLPLPPHVDTAAVHYDGSGTVLPPVVGAVAAIADTHRVSFQDKMVTVVGAGRLVGAPAALWVEAQGGIITVVTNETPIDQVQTALSKADIIITGAGVPGLVTPDQVQPGVVVFDAGTSEDGGALVGDVDPTVAEKAALFTPVPGGIGPLTIACLLRNLVTLKDSQHSVRSDTVV